MRTKRSIRILPHRPQLLKADQRRTWRHSRSPPTGSRRANPTTLMDLDPGSFNQRCGRLTATATTGLTCRPAVCCFPSRSRNPGAAAMFRVGCSWHDDASVVNTTDQLVWRCRTALREHYGAHSIAGWHPAALRQDRGDSMLRLRQCLSKAWRARHGPLLQLPRDRRANRQGLGLDLDRRPARSVCVSGRCSAVRVAELVGSRPVIRPPGHGAEWLGMYADLLPAGIMVPMVNDAAQATAVVDAVCVFRRGKRSLRLARPATCSGRTYSTATSTCSSWRRSKQSRRSRTASDHRQPRHRVPVLR